MPNHSPALTVLAMFCAPALCVAQAPANPPASPTPAPQTITLHELLVRAVNTNLELQAKRIDPLIQDNRLTAAWGVFEPNWVSAYNIYRNERPQTASVTSSIFGGVGSIYIEDVQHSETGITGKLPTGTQYQISTSIDRSKNTYNRAVENKSGGFFPEYVAGSTLTLVQPLLKDFGFSANLAEIRLQRSAKTASIYDTESTMLRILRDVTSAYFEMVFAQENIRVKQQAVDVAEKLVRENQRRFDEGRMAVIDVTQAQSRLSEAREELILAQNFLAQRRNTLRELTQDNFAFDEAEFVVDAEFIQRTAPAVDRDHSLDVLFKKNPSYLSAMEIAESENVRVAYAKNQRWPRVDLKGSFGYNGLHDDFTGSYKDYAKRDDPSWSAGVVVSIPLIDKAERGRVAEAKNRKRQALYTLKHTEVVLLSSFDTAIRDINSAAERVKLVKDSVALAQAAADAENARLATGKTTSYNVAQALRDLSQAQSRELATLVDLNKAIVQFQFVLGTLPDYLHIEVKVANEPLNPRKSKS